MWLVTVFSSGFLKWTFRNNLCSWHYFGGEWPHTVVTPSFLIPLVFPAPLTAGRGNLAGVSGHVCRTAEKHKQQNTLCTCTNIHMAAPTSFSFKKLKSIRWHFGWMPQPLQSDFLTPRSSKPGQYFTWLFAPSEEGMVSLVERVYAFGNSFLHSFLTVCFCLSSS